MAWRRGEALKFKQGASVAQYSDKTFALVGGPTLEKGNLGTRFSDEIILYNQEHHVWEAREEIHKIKFPIKQLVVPVAMTLLQAPNSPFQRQEWGIGRSRPRLSYLQRFVMPWSCCWIIQALNYQSQNVSVASQMTQRQAQSL